MDQDEILNLISTDILSNMPPLCYDSGMKAEYETRAFVSAADWRQWLDEHHADTDGIWMRIYKKASRVETVTYAEALDEALCFGWIDGQKKKYDELSFVQKFTPRRKASLWSKRNVEHVGRLIETGRMTPAGLAEVNRAKEDGRWNAAYDAPSSMTIPNYFFTELHKNPDAEKFFKTLNKSNKYAIAWRLRTAKAEETRKRRLDKIIKMLKSKEKP